MARVQFTIRSERSPEQVLTDLIDFSPARPTLWPAIDPAAYRVNDVGDTWADVVEGSDVMGGIWARERYDWSTPGVVRATIQESNFWHPGGMWEMRVEPDDAGGSTLVVTRDRRPKTAKARVLEAMMRAAGRRLLAQDLLKAPAISAHAAAAQKV